MSNLTHALQNNLAKPFKMVELATLSQLDLAMVTS